jgi:hypothetical protein
MLSAILTAWSKVTMALDWNTDIVGLNHAQDMNMHPHFSVMSFVNTGLMVDQWPIQEVLHNGNKNLCTVNGRTGQTKEKCMMFH